MIFLWNVYSLAPFFQLLLKICTNNFAISGFSAPNVLISSLNVLIFVISSHLSLKQHLHRG